MKQVPKSLTTRIFQSLGFDEDAKRPSLSVFSRSSAPKDWKVFTFDSHVPVYHIVAPRSKTTDIRSFINGIQAENYLLIANLDEHDLLVISRSKKGENPLIIPLRKQEDYDRVVLVFQKLNFTSDTLTAHSSIHSAYDLLKRGAERYFINRGLFSNYFLRERLFKTLSERKRDPGKEAKGLLSALNGELPTHHEGAIKILQSLGYSIKSIEGNEYSMHARSHKLEAGLILTTNDNLDIRVGDLPVPAYQAVEALSRYTWVILTNGRLWRLYSSRISSTSTDYFEIDLDEPENAKEECLPVYQILNDNNLVAWEDEFAEYIGDYKRHQDIKSIITSLQQLFTRYKIGARERGKAKAIKPEDLILVGCMFLTDPTLKEWKVMV